MNNNVNNRKGGEKKKNNNNKFLLIYVVVAFLFLYSFSTAKEMLTTKEISYNEFVQMVKDKEVKEVTVDGTALVITPQDSSDMKGKVLYTGNADNPDLIQLLIDNDVQYYPQITKQQSVWMDFIILNVLPLVIMFFVVRFIFNKMSKKMGGGPMGMGGMGKSNAKVYVEKDIKVSFEDVAGQDEAKESLTEIIDFLHNPKRYTEIGAKLPKGALLVGPPGTGKTLIAKAVAGEAKVPFLSVSGSTFVEMFVGMGAAKVRDLFKEAEKMAPCIIFIDEIDAVGRQRGAGLGGGHDEREQTLNQLLVEMDGFSANEGVIVLAATNRPDVLDKALLRPGRFDRQIVVSSPDVKAREQILEVHSRKKKIADDVDLKTIAKNTAGFSGADLENVLNEAALLAARRDKKEITMTEIEDAMVKVTMGPEKKSRVRSEKENKLVAFHEAGHAVVSKFLPTQDTVHQISIVPRGMAGGYTMYKPDEDKNFMSKTEMEETIISLLGGRVAEQLVLNDISTGASNDIERASKIARDMVTRYGMSDKIGTITFGSGQEEVFLGRDLAQTKNFSEETAAKIDEEVKRIIDEAYNKAKTILSNNMDKLSKVAQVLLEKEKIDGDEFAAIFEE